MTSQLTLHKELCDYLEHVLHLLDIPHHEYKHLRNYESLCSAAHSESSGDARQWFRRECDSAADDGVTCSSNSFDCDKEAREMITDAVVAILDEYGCQVLSGKEYDDWSAFSGMKRQNYFVADSEEGMLVERLRKVYFRAMD